MNIKEKQLFMELCKFKETTFKETLIKYATPNVLGNLFFNRMQGVAYHTLERNELLGKVNREFKNSLKSSYEQNIKKNESFFICVEKVSQILEQNKINAALLKGAYLCAYYPKGYRTSNDIDILILPKDITKLGNILEYNGFEQGSIKNNIFVPATRKEIIESKMTRGETVPYIKEVNLPYMKYLEIDINFSLDYKNSNVDILQNMLSHISKVTVNNISLLTLQKSDFFLHLCAHLYKEATTYPWIKMKRDMTLYKYLDIYTLINCTTNKEFQNIFNRAYELKLEKIFAFTILQTMDLFDIKNNYLRLKSYEILKDSPDFTLKVYSPRDKKELLYQTNNTKTRFFLENREKDLKEIIL